MSEMIEKHVYELFKPENGKSKYTKTYCRENSGEYIVYTGTTIGVFGKVDVADYLEPNLTFTTDGENAGTIQYITDVGYCIGGHRTILKPIVPNLDLLYFKFVLQSSFFENVKKGDVPSLHFSQVKNIKVPVPVYPDGCFDLNKQKELAKKYQDIEIKRQTLLNKVEKLKKAKIVVETNEKQKFAQLKFNEIFKLSRGKIISKAYIYEHQGVFPVYSTQKNVYGHIDTYMKDGQFLLWNTDGLAGYIKKTDGKFSFTNIVGIMIPNPEVDMNSISLDYLKCYLEPIFREHRKGRMGINGKNEYTKLNSTMIKKLDISIPIPINADGTFSLEKQIELAQKYATIESIKNDVFRQISELTSINVIM